MFSYKNKTDYLSSYSIDHVEELTNSQYFLVNFFITINLNVPIH